MNAYRFAVLSLALAAVFVMARYGVNFTSFTQQRDPGAAAAETAAAKDELFEVGKTVDSFNDRFDSAIFIAGTKIEGSALTLVADRRWWNQASERDQEAMRIGMLRVWRQIYASHHGVSNPAVQVNIVDIAGYDIVSDAAGG